MPKAMLSALVLMLHGAVAGVPTDTFKSCSVPKFEWATYGTRASGRMYAMSAAVSGDYLFAAGYLKSTLDPAQPDFAPSTTDYSVTGPFSAADPTAVTGKTITVDLKSYPASAGAKENAGGSFAQYEVGVVKISLLSGEPVDIFVYSGEGMDEMSGLAARGDVLAISGHFVGNLTAKMVDGTTYTIWNSNMADPDPADQFHPNARDATANTGHDDGFVIKARASSGKADWIVRFPASNKDSQVVGVDVDGEGNVFGSGYACSQPDSSAAKECRGFIAKFAAADGALLWERWFDDLGAALWIKHDAADGSLYFTATTTFGGSAKGAKQHGLCGATTCAVTGRLSAVDGTTAWLRTFEASPRWGIFDHSGDVEIAAGSDGPYIYVAFDDAAETGVVTLDEGTPYAGCKAATQEVTAEYLIATDKVITAADCPTGSTFVARTDPEAVPATAAGTNAFCGHPTGQKNQEGCVIKYHKHTGKPMWARSLPPVTALVPSPDGDSVYASGWYYSKLGDFAFDSVVLPGYLRVGGLGSQKWGIYNAKLRSGDGGGEHVLHSGGGLNDRIYDMVGDGSGNIYNVGWMQNTVMHWGGSLSTKMSEGGVPQAADTGMAPVASASSHMFVAKLAAPMEAVPSCLSTCTQNTDDATISSGFCFIDGVCYAEGATAAAFGTSCLECVPAVSQTEWSPGHSYGKTHCHIDRVCWENGAFLFTQRKTHSAKQYSECQRCEALASPTEWSVKWGYQYEGTCKATGKPAWQLIAEEAAWKPPCADKAAARNRRAMTPAGESSPSGLVGDDDDA